ncbi:energy-coupling factor ABC transporter ATP-binding protein [Massilia niastensis]|uniref:energy-coupling factor ABC transporter ATP-binding protein n=1 Tax=Massilia niastensis TaxID=544911 RepID=UPI001E3487DE|nr:energy-coupling factor ABC transporter ATP-binding protein [Massilia niastensis]
MSQPAFKDPMAQEEALLVVNRLRKAFGQRLMFDIEDWCIEAGRAYVLTGANGVGKTTLLRILAGLESADVSDITFLGRPARLHPYPPELRQAVVYVHQHPVMFSTSVEKNIAYGLEARGLPKQEIAGRVGAALEWAGVTHLTDARPQNLSGGEKQRVALARAKVLEPTLLLLDEPTANLDGASREQVIALIPELVEAGTSVIMACHDRDLIALPGTLRLKLQDGQLHLRAGRRAPPTASLLLGGDRRT